MSEQTNASGAQVPCISLWACPFCGGAMRERVNIYFPDYQVACNDCGARGPRRKPSDSPEEALRLWNTRHANKKVEAPK
jgi:Lar family restriction alleviation protein